MTSATHCKYDREARVALAVEAAALALALAWVTQLLSPANGPMPASQQRDVRALLGVLALLMAAAGAAALVTPWRLPEQLRNTFRCEGFSCCMHKSCTVDESIDWYALRVSLANRRERDMGLVVGCTLLPLVLLSRLTAQLYQSGEFSGE